ncbi:hypothetical protein QFZ56_003065 [Streptomyces achromogenes]|uniref:Barstar (barnase inhibitor) domain-containing protein n=1 Tax=Streptomyces achromogenes TaxID=67255 RepID=A0ABU0Q0D1_STRAH|nr:barstar family protein [Streptomyces achromogenes]MDQ0684102.1 hypothetical protein [Streptomyces achromogenes]
MTTPSLTRPTSPWVFFTSRNDPWVSAETTALHDKHGLVFRLHSRDLLEPASLFRTFARELSFPGFFGHNWDALVDCLHDWHGPGHGEGKAVAILIEDADALLATEFLGVLVSVLCQAAWKANLQLDADGVPHGEKLPFPLHFVLLLNYTPSTVFAEAVSKGRYVHATLRDGRLTATLSSDYWADADPVVGPPDQHSD